MAGDKTIVIDLERDVIGGAVHVIRQFFRVSLAGLVKSAARDTGRVSMTLGARFLGTDLKPREEEPAVDLPVILPRGGGYGLYLDVAPGDLGVALCGDRPVRGLYETGAVVTPQRASGHDYGSAVFFPGGRVSSTDTPTPPPNAAGTMLLGADDMSAAVELRRMGGPSPDELGTVVVRSAGPTSSLQLGGPAAVLGVARLADPVDASPAMLVWLSQVTAAINALAPGAVTPLASPTIGQISGASAKVVSE